MSNPHSDYRGLHFSSETLRAMEQGKREQDSQDRRLERLKRGREARERKRTPDGQKEEVPTELTVPTVEAPRSPVARFLRFLARRVGGPERF